jgi:hypothetical protein
VIVPLGRYLLITLEPALPRHRVAGLFCALRLHPGVLSVVDLAAISQATLDVILRPPSPCAPAVGPTRRRRVRKGGDA